MTTGFNDASNAHLGIMPRKKSYDATDYINADDIELIGKTQYVYHMAKRNVVIYKAYRDPTYFVLLDFVRYSSYKCRLGPPYGCRHARRGPPVKLIYRL